MAASILAAIDAGAEYCAVAIFVNCELRLLYKASTLELSPRAVRCDRAVYELPQADGRAAPVDDLIRTAAGGAKVAAWLSADVAEYQPRQWKGAMSKAPHHRQAWDAFSDAERALLGGDATLAAIESACKRGAAVRWQKRGPHCSSHFYSAKELPTVDGLKITHDLLDAAALGLHDLGRLGRGKVSL